MGSGLCFGASASVMGSQTCKQQASSSYCALCWEIHAPPSLLLLLKGRYYTPGSNEHGPRV